MRTLLRYLAWLLNVRLEILMPQIDNQGDQFMVAINIQKCVGCSGTARLRPASRQMYHPPKLLGPWPAAGRQTHVLVEPVHVREELTKSRPPGAGVIPPTDGRWGIGSRCMWAWVGGVGGDVLSGLAKALILFYLSPVVCLLFDLKSS